MSTDDREALLAWIELLELIKAMREREDWEESR